MRTASATTLDAVTEPVPAQTIPAQIEPDAGVHEPVAPPPVTGHRVVDDALRELADLPRVPVEQHHDRLQAAQEVLQGVLNASREHLQPTIPGVPASRG